MDHKELEALIITQLKTVYDPEIPVDIYELGLIYNIHIHSPEHVSIEMTLTSPACPEAEIIPGRVEEAVKEIENIEKVEVNVTFEPAWEKGMMSEEAQLELGMM